jgi:hypothetical protein
LIICKFAFGISYLAEGGDQAATGLYLAICLAGACLGLIAVGGIWNQTFLYSNILICLIGFGLNTIWFIGNLAFSITKIQSGWDFMLANVEIVWTIMLTIMGFLQFGSMHVFCSTVYNLQNPNQN